MLGNVNHIVDVSPVGRSGGVMEPYPIDTKPEIKGLLHSLTDDIGQAKTACLEAWSHAKKGEDWRLPLVETSERLEDILIRIKALLTL